MKLSANKRNKETSLKQLRKEDKIPGVVYGNKLEENILITVPENKVRSAWKSIKNKETFTLDIEGTEYSVILKDMQVHVVSGDVLHLDFFIQE